MPPLAASTLTFSRDRVTGVLAAADVNLRSFLLPQDRVKVVGVTDPEVFVAAVGPVEHSSHVALRDQHG